MKGPEVNTAFNRRCVGTTWWRGMTEGASGHEGSHVCGTEIEPPRARTDKHERVYSRRTGITANYEILRDHWQTTAGLRCPIRAPNRPRAYMSRA